MKILNSKYKNVEYYMYGNKIVVKGNDNELCINLPRDENDKFVDFYDMYYSKEKIYVIVATRGPYDFRYILDEAKFELVYDGLSK